MMAIAFDSVAELFIDVRASGIVGYGATAIEATQMADAVEAARVALAKTRVRPLPVRRYWFNVEKWRFEPVLEWQK